MKTTGFSDFLMDRALFFVLLITLTSSCGLNNNNSTSSPSPDGNNTVPEKSGVGIIGTGKTILSANRVSNLVAPTTVKIEGAVEGSGIIIQKDGDIYTVATAWHVIKDNRPGEEIVVVTNDNKFNTVVESSLQKIDNVDLGLLTFKSKTEYSYALLGQASDSQSGETIYVSGYPLSTTSVPIRVRRFTKGEVVANASMFMSNGYQLLYSNQTLPGMSGGGVFDRYGRLIGIHGLAETDIKLTSQTGLAVKTGTNQGIPVLQYLESGTQQIKKDADGSIDSKLLKISQLLDTERPRDGGNRGYRFAFNGFEDEVIRLANEALSIKPNNYHLYNYRGLAKKSRPTPSEKKIADKFREFKITGESYYDYLLKQTRGDRTSPNSASESFHAENKISAVLDFKKAYEIKPDFLTARINAAQSYQELGYHNLAIQEIDKALEFDDANTGLHILRGSINRSIARTKMEDKFGEQQYSQGKSNYAKAIFRDSCNDLKNAAELGSLIAGLYIIDSATCAAITYKKNEALIGKTMSKLSSIILFHEKAFAPYLDPSTGYMQREVARNDQKNHREQRAYESFQKYIQATFAKGMLLLIAGEKEEACDLLEYTYGVSTKLSIIMSFELDSNLDNKSVHYRRFDPWNFDNVCDLNFNA